MLSSEELKRPEAQSIVLEKEFPEGMRLLTLEMIAQEMLKDIQVMKALDTFYARFDLPL